MTQLSQTFTLLDYGVFGAYLLLTAFFVSILFSGCRGRGLTFLVRIHDLNLLAV